jgi:lactate 2-monooxygenase
MRRPGSDPGEPPIKLPAMTERSPRPPSVFANYQYEIYLAGLSATLPELPITADGLEAAARERLPAGAYGYVAGGAGGEETMRANREAFGR